VNRSIVRRALLIAPATALALTTGIASAQTTGTFGWRTVKTVSVLAQTALFGVTTSGPAHAWAVGPAISSDGNTSLPVVESWDGSAWAQVSRPASVVSALGQSGSFLDCTAALGPTNVWAFSLFGRWLHGNGATWTAGKLAGGQALVQASLATGKSTVWAFGGRPTSSGIAPFAAFHAGALGWKRTSVPGTGAIAAASAVSSTDIWAVLGTGAIGIGGRAGGLVHRFGGVWHKVVSLPASLRNASLGAVLARSDKNVWVGGAVKNGKMGTTEAIGHWNGHRWKVFRLRVAASAARYRVVSMVTDGAGGIWALGLCIGTTSQQGAAVAPDLGGKCTGGFASRLWHETAGQWSLPVLPKLATRAHALLSLAAAGKSTWGVGLVRAGTTGLDGLIALRGPIPN